MVKCKKYDVIIANTLNLQSYEDLHSEAKVLIALKNGHCYHLRIFAFQFCLNFKFHEST